MKYLLLSLLLIVVACIGQKTPKEPIPEFRFKNYDSIMALGPQYQKLEVSDSTGVVVLLQWDPKRDNSAELYVFTDSLTAIRVMVKYMVKQTFEIRDLKEKIRKQNAQQL